MRHGTITLATADDALARRWQAACNGAPILRVRRFADFADAENVVLVDSVLPGLPGFDDAGWKRGQGLRLVFASSKPNDQEGIAAIDAGFVGYCHAYCSPEQLRQIFDVVESGELWLGRSLVTRLVNAVSAAAQPQMTNDWAVQLTDREQDVARRAALAESNAEIAAALGIGERTVKAHLSGIFEKLGVTDRLQLALKVHGIR